MTPVDVDAITLRVTAYALKPVWTGPIELLLSADRIVRKDTPALLGLLEVYRDALRDLADHGVRHDLTPTVSLDHSEPVPVGYLRSIDNAVRDRARRALDA